MPYDPMNPNEIAFDKKVKGRASTPLNNNNNNDVRFVYSETSPMGNNVPFNMNPSDGFPQEPHGRFGTVQPDYNPAFYQQAPTGPQIFQPQMDSTISTPSMHYPTSSTQNYPEPTPIFGMSPSNNNNNNNNDQTPNISNIMNNQFASYALNYTAFLAKESAQKFNVSSGWLDKVKRYFDVDNRYVMKKLLIILFPFMHRDWSCGTTTTTTEGCLSNEMTPRKNVNFPDLYIPLMAFWTSMVLYASVLGYKNMFQPALLSIYISSCCGMFIFELLFFTVVFYLSGFYERYSLLQMMALCGYKYVAVVEGILAYFVIGNWNFFFILYVSLMFVLFICKNSRLLLMPSYTTENNSSYGGVYQHYSHNQHQTGSSKRLAILSIIGILQPLQIYYSVHKVSTLMSIVGSGS